MTRNVPPSGTQLLSSLEEQLRSILPSGWSLAPSRERPVKAAGDLDAVFVLSGPDRTRARLLIETKRTVEPRNVDAALRQIAASQHGQRGGRGQHLALVAAPYLSPMARERLAAAGAGWFDATGNLRVQLERPSLFIDRLGASRSPFTDRGDRRLKSLRGAAGARVVRTLLDGSGPRGVRALATEAEVATASASRVLDLLAREGVVVRDTGGAVISVQRRSLAWRWAQDYGLTTTNSAVSVLAARGIDRLLKDLARQRQRYALTGSAAARVYLPADQLSVASLVLPVVYVADAVSARTDLDLRPAERGGNVLLVEPFDEVVYRGATSHNGLRYVAASQAVVDLLTGPGRSAEEATQLLDLLARGDAAWAQ